MSDHLPWGINSIKSLYHPDVSAGLPDGRYVAAVCVPCPLSIRERLRAVWWVFTGKAHAFVWPKPGDLEDIGLRQNPVLRAGGGRPFIPIRAEEFEPVDHARLARNFGVSLATVEYAEGMIGRLYRRLAAPPHSLEMNSVKWTKTKTSDWMV